MLLRETIVGHESALRDTLAGHLRDVFGRTSSNTTAPGRPPPVASSQPKTNFRSSKTGFRNERFVLETSL